MSCGLTSIGAMPSPKYHSGMILRVLILCVVVGQIQDLMDWCIKPEHPQFGRGCAQLRGPARVALLSCSVARGMPLYDREAVTTSSRKNKGEIGWSTGSSLGL
jgi:hypothetical protein